MSTEATRSYSEAAQAPAVTVVVHNLPIGTTAPELRALCEHVGEVVEVEIPSRTALFTKFIYGFVRFANLETSRAAVKKLSSIVVGNRHLRAQIAREHWRNTNEVTVPRAGVEGGLDDDDDDDEEEEEEEERADESTRSVTEKVDANSRPSSGAQRYILRECRWQWQLHRRRHPNRGAGRHATS
ncbi:RNA-binding protein 28-like [Eriocheir sinensis]|uniref:RNA-binding protein 28-like n=1 Tax=Eriocheir sinensis TaxID=95602 RepID=UPI0021C67EF8|nr:RNA-binding protein 28-like [Eriocheir sinensis]